MKTFNNPNELQRFIEKNAGVIVTSASCKCDGTFESYLSAYPEGTEYKQYGGKGSKKFYDGKPIAQASSFNCESNRVAKSVALSNLAEELNIEIGDVTHLFRPPHSLSTI